MSMGRLSIRTVVMIPIFAYTAACSGGSLPASISPLSSAPPASEVLGRLAAPRDFHISYVTHFLVEGPLGVNTRAYMKKTWSGSGNVVLQPRLIANVHETNSFCADLCPLDEIVVDTDRYTKGMQSAWNVDHGIALDNYYWTAILPSVLSRASPVRVAGQQRVDGHQTWVVDARMADGQAFRVWIRQDDAYPVRLESAPNAKTPYVHIEIDLSAFNRGLTIEPPPRDALDPLFWGTEYNRERAIPLNGGSVTVHASVYNCHGGPELYDSVDTGFFVLVPFTYTAGNIPLRVDPGAWRVYGTFGRPYEQQPVGTGHQLVEQSLRSTHSISGDLCFLLPWNENRFALVGNLPAGIVTSSVGGVLLPDSSGQASPQSAWLAA